MSDETGLQDFHTQQLLREIAEARKAGLPKDQPLRNFTVQRHGFTADEQGLVTEILQAHAVDVMSSGALAFRVNIGGTDFNVRTFASGSWFAVSSEPYTREHMEQMLVEQLDVAEQRIRGNGGRAGNVAADFDLSGFDSPTRN